MLNKSKAPAFQFYVRDWLSDPQLRQASPSAKGIWIDCLCFMWESIDRGTLCGTVGSLSRMLGVHVEEFEAFLAEAERLNFADATLGNGNVTLRNRRMVREQKGKENTKLRVRRHRCNAQCNTEITPPSSSSSSSSLKETSLRSVSLTPLPPTGAALAQEPEQSEPKAKKATAKDRRAEMFGQVQAAYPTAFNRHLASETTGRNAYTADLQAHENHGFATEGDMHEHVLAQIRKASNSERWLEDDGKYIPGIGKFLKNRLWRGNFEAPDALFTPHRGANVPGLSTDNSLPARFGPA